MARQIRYVPPGGSLVEVTARCLQQRFLLRPSRRINQLIIGVLARAQRRYSVRVIAPVALSNHMHLLVWADDAEELSSFMRYVGSNIAREIGLENDWSGKFWEVRYRPIAVTEEEAAQVARLAYLLAHGCKENLVASPRQWPGVHAGPAILSGRPSKGVWVDRTALGRARLRKKKGTVRAVDFEEAESLELARLPCWEHLSAEEYRLRVKELVDEIEVETAARHRRDGTRPLGRKAVLKASPHTRPKASKQSPAPRVHAATKKCREAFEAAYRWFVEAFRAASARLRQGDRQAQFPEGSFPPGLPFVRPGSRVLQPP